MARTTNLDLQTASENQLTEEEKLNWLRLYRSQNVGPHTFYQLISRFGSAALALENLPELIKRAGGSKIKLSSPEETHQEADNLQKIGASFITFSESHYPSLLKHIHDPPPILTFRGNIALANQMCLGVVGARNASITGLKFTEKLASDLGAHGNVVVSGLARGVDQAAHQNALETGTIAVIAGGIDSQYPPENKTLYEQIYNKGCVITEMPFGFQPKAVHFPKRNRIISGISQGVILIEAAAKSGTLITAQYALEQAREVFAVPGFPYDPRSKGCNALIRQGAILIRNVHDVLEVLGQEAIPQITPSSHQTNPIVTTERTSETEIDAAREKIIKKLSSSPISIDELARECHFSPAIILNSLTELELVGKVHRIAGNKVTRVS